MRPKLFKTPASVLQLIGQKQPRLLRLPQSIFDLITIWTGGRNLCFWAKFIYSLKNCTNIIYMYDTTTLFLLPSHIDFLSYLLFSFFHLHRVNKFACQRLFQYYYYYYLCFPIAATIYVHTQIRTFEFFARNIGMFRVLLAVRVAPPARSSSLSLVRLFAQNKQDSHKLRAGEGREYMHRILRPKIKLWFFFLFVHIAARR